MGTCHTNSLHDMVGVTRGTSRQPWPCVSDIKWCGDVWCGVASCCVVTDMYCAHLDTSRDKSWTSCTKTAVHTRCFASWTNVSQNRTAHLIICGSICEISFVLCMLVPWTCHNHWKTLQNMTSTCVTALSLFSSLLLSSPLVFLFIVCVVRLASSCP